MNPQSQHTCIYVPVGSSTQLKWVFTLPRRSFTLTAKKGKMNIFRNGSVQFEAQMKCPDW